MAVDSIQDAVTALVTVGDQLLMVRRQEQLGTFPGYHAFPGGKVDPQDHSAPEQLEGAKDIAHAMQALLSGTAPSAAEQDTSPALLRALARELNEEIGLDLSALLEQNGVLELRWIGRAITPPGIGRKRMNTRFFLIRLKDRPELRLDHRELAEGHWASRQEWLARYHDGQMLLPPPTLSILREMGEHAEKSGKPGKSGETGESAANFVDCDQLRDDQLPRRFDYIHGVRMFTVPSNTLPPAHDTNAFVLGDDDAHRVLVDPSPKTKQELDRLLERLAPLGINEVFLTHHHSDHRQFAEEIARQLGLPMGMSLDTSERIQRRQPKIFEGITIKCYSDGDVLTHWLGRPVRTLAIPGHDEGHLALMPDDRAWCIVGDLIQGVGTVVVGGAEGNMAKYFESLERIIALAPKAIYPSHGHALGGVHFLQKALDHRRQREAQILALHEQGVPPGEMITKVYQNLDPRMLPLAKVNVDAHLAKLRAEGRLGT